MNVVALEERPERCCGVEPVLGRWHTGPEQARKARKRYECPVCGEAARGWHSSVARATREWNGRRYGWRTND